LGRDGPKHKFGTQLNKLLKEAQYTTPLKRHWQPATEYVNPSNGEFVVVDNTTEQVIQVSGLGQLPNYLKKK